MSETRNLTFDEAIDLLKKIVKYSCVPGQKHIDMGLVNAHDLKLYEEAMKVVMTAVSNQELTDEELKAKINLG